MKRKNQRWSNDQTAVLVEEWKSRIEKVESSQSNDAWQGILIEVNKIEPKKTVKQCKDKMKNLKQSYKESKAKNKETGESPQRSQFYDELDEVLGTCAVMTMPGRIQVGQNNNDDTRDTSTPVSTVSTLTDLSAGVDSDCDSLLGVMEEINGKEKEKGKEKAEKNKGGKRKRAKEDDSDSGASDGMNGKGKGKVEGQVRGKGGKRKRAKDDKNSFVDLTEKFIDVQTKQIEMLDRCQERTKNLLIKLEMDQRKAEEEGRKRDQELLMKMAEILAKKN